MWSPFGELTTDQVEELLKEIAKARLCKRTQTKDRQRQAIVHLHLAECDLFFERWPKVQMRAYKVLELLEGRDVPETRQALDLLIRATIAKHGRDCRRHLKTVRPLLLAGQ